MNRVVVVTGAVIASKLARRGPSQVRDLPPIALHPKFVALV